MKVRSFPKYVQELMGHFIADACKTYEFTWAIREASERSRAESLARKTSIVGTVMEEEEQ